MCIFSCQDANKTEIVMVFRFGETSMHLKVKMQYGPDHLSHESMSPFFFWEHRTLLALGCHVVQINVNAEDDLKQIKLPKE